MKQRFLTIYDYGTGGVWQYVHAEDEAQVLARYPALQIVKEQPAWVSKLSKPLREYDIDAEPDSVMARFTKKHDK